MLRPNPATAADPAAILLGPVVRFFTLLTRKPLQDLRKVAVNRLRRQERAACYKPVQVPDLPAKCRLQDPMYLAQSQGAPEPNRRQISGSLSISTTRTSRTESCPTEVPASSFSLPPFFRSHCPTAKTSDVCPGAVDSVTEAYRHPALGRGSCMSQPCILWLGSVPKRLGRRPLEPRSPSSATPPVRRYRLRLG
jgi:hypothetical protein